MTRVPVTTERMSDQFTRLHLEGGKFPITLHHFTGPELGDAHDHPYAFTTTILAGGYVEEVWRRGKDGWSSRLIHREVGTSHRVGRRHRDRSPTQWRHRRRRHLCRLP
jgi:hypothetical protein